MKRENHLDRLDYGSLLYLDRDHHLAEPDACHIEVDGRAGSQLEDQLAEKEEAAAEGSCTGCSPSHCLLWTLTVLQLEGVEIVQTMNLMSDSSAEKSA